MITPQVFAESPDEAANNQMTRPKEVRSEDRSSISWLGLVVLMTNVGLAGLVLLAWIKYGSVGSGLALLRGERLIPDTYSKSFGRADKGSTLTSTFRLTNFMSRPVTITGGRSSCTCILPVDLPMTIPPSKSLPFNVQIHTGRKLGNVSESIRLYTDAPEVSELVLRISGTVVPIHDTIK